MKTKIMLLCIFVFLLSGRLYSQLPNQNMYLLANLNQHITNDTYSGCYGYTSPNGREYAILGTHLGTAFIDITDSSNIHEVDFVPAPFPTNSGNHWREITVYSHYAYIVCEAAFSGIEIVDLSYLPDSVRYVSKYELPNYLTGHTISVSGNYLYINGSNSTFNGNGVTVLDLTSDPETPIRRGTWNTMYVHDSRIVNDTIFAANIYTGTLTIINAVDKDNLLTIASFQTAPHFATHNCAVTRDRKYVYTTDETGNPSAGTLKIFNIQNLSNILYVGDWRPTGITTSQVHNVEIYGDTAVVAHRTAGVRVLNISNPSAPIEIAWYDTYPANNNNEQVGTWGVFMFPSKKIICSNKETGLWVFKMGTTVGINNNLSNVVDFKLEQNYPNPFNPSTIIKYSISGSGGLVKLTVYDIHGRQLKTLVNGYRNKGSFTVEFNSGGFSSGVYFYKLTVNDNLSEVKKMIVLK
ncbi:MAG: choice-of-anchor B family protein [Ignavibacteria bacterium]